MEHLIERLITFRGWGDRPFVRNLAASGFYREFNSDYTDAVKCYFCRCYTTGKGLRIFLQSIYGKYCFLQLDVYKTYDCIPAHFHVNKSVVII